MVVLVRRYLAIFCAGLLLVLGLSACSPNQLRNPTAQVSQIIESQLGDPGTFNYALNNSSPNVFGYTYEGLITEDGLTSEIEPAIAESWEVSDDKKSLTFTLKDNLKWSDGEPLTVDDVVFTYNSIYLNPEIQTDIQDILRIGKERKLPKVEKVGPKQVKFTTPEPFAPFLRTMSLGIMPQHALAKTITEKDRDGKPLFLSTWSTNDDPKSVITNGMYTLEEYVSGQRVTFRRNPNYWRQDAEGKKQPYVERLVWKLVDNRDTTLIKFRSGESDIIEPLRPEDFPLLKNEEKRGKFKVYMGEARPVTTFMSFNLNQGKRDGKPVVDPIKSKWFNNTAFRQAVAYAIDRNKMNTNSYRGLGVLINSFISTRSPYSLSPEQGLKVYDYDPEKAKKLLTDAGFKYNGSQLEDSAGNPVEFTLMTNSSNTLRVSLIAQIKQDLADIGIKVNLNPINFNTLIEKIGNTYDWQAYLLAFGSGPEPHYLSHVWQPDGASHGFNQRAEGGTKMLEGQQVSDWEKEMGRLYTQGATELDDAKRREIYGKVQQIGQEQLPWIPLVVERIMAVGRNKVEGVRYPESGGITWNIHELRVAE
ncbi:ABC transporter substrate-binding protein [filamentous cyanobacterium LEGE 11480]|uniref:ABC transporter substrate-binding protein n=1 Tax=Romeriopsis navalis LEGE 11480 TaxID=2777977 RepID=A0A928Z4V2_9CYAN|nr:ABC transporter substrate-binding protein [Romeriopsis navalis]MBE9030783.1 ABC transporter substrate-binding protein [Romeriopsis navalis LEGE 11480]